MTMNSFGTAIAVILALTIWSVHSEVSKEVTQYTTKYDNVNLSEILKTERLFDNYVKCLLGEKPCTADGAELKRLLPDAIETNCEKCSEKQRQSSKEVVLYLIDNKPEVWSKLEIRYDPEGAYRKRYLESKQMEISVAPVTTPSPDK